MPKGLLDLLGRQVRRARPDRWDRLARWVLRDRPATRVLLAIRDRLELRDLSATRVLLVIRDRLELRVLSAIRVLPATRELRV